MSHTILVDIGTSHLLGRYTMTNVLHLLMDSPNHPVKRRAGQQLRIGHQSQFTPQPTGTVKY